MRKRNIEIKVRLYPNEHKALIRKAKSAGLSREGYIRTLILGYVPRAQPHADFAALIMELSAIGRNINQIAVKANTLGIIDAGVFLHEAAKLSAEVLEIKQAVLMPDKVVTHGNNKNLERTS